MDAAEFLTYQNVSIATITGISVHPQDSFHKFFTVHIDEQFRGMQVGTQITVDGNKAWRLFNGQVGDKMLLFSSMKEGKYVANNRLTMIVPSEAQLARQLEGSNENSAKYITQRFDQDKLEMNEIYKRMRNFGPKLADGTHEIKDEKRVLKRYTVVNGELNGEFTTFDYNGKVAQKGKFVDGKRAGVWKYFSNGEEHSEEDFGEVVASVGHFGCY